MSLLYLDTWRGYLAHIVLKRRNEIGWTRALGKASLRFLRWEQLPMKEIMRDGLRFPTESSAYEVPPELGEELTRLNQEMADEKNCQTPEVQSQASGTERNVS